MTDIQAHKLVRPYYGKWLRLSGALDSVERWSESRRYSYVSLRNFIPPEAHVLFRFRDKQVLGNRLALLATGTEITVIGEIQSVTENYITLDMCELESVQGENVTYRS
jgi:hypothetical protein